MNNYIPMQGITMDKSSEVKTIQGDVNSQKSDQLPIANLPPSPFALSSFLCACSLRRFWLLSFTISCGGQEVSKGRKK